MSVLLVVAVRVSGGCGASRLVCKTNGQTGVTTGQSADPFVFLCLGGGASVGSGLAEGPFTLLRGKHDMCAFRRHVFNYHAV